MESRLSFTLTEPLSGKEIAIIKLVLLSRSDVFLNLDCAQDSQL